MKYEEKQSKLEEILRGYGSLAVAFSGGVDSTFLLLFGQKVLKENIIAVTAVGPNFDPDEIEYAKKFCAKEDISHLVLDLGDKILDALSDNPPDRCYYCKKAIFQEIVDTVPALYPGAVIVDGTNVDDMSDYRPGHKALKEIGIVNPLKEAGLTKEEIRRGLKDLGVEIWDKPAAACLASRIPYGEPITADKLLTIYQAEKEIKALGFRQIRVRHHGNLARIEIGDAEQKRFLDQAVIAEVNAKLKSLGFLYVTLDLAGYQMGSLNQALEK